MPCNTRSTAYKSMTDSVMPSCPKRATIMSSVKRSGLEKEDMKNHRPIPRLPFPAKHPRKVVARDIEERMEINDSRDLC